MLSRRFFYTVVLYFLLPYIFLYLLWRARKQPEYLFHIAERFGFYSVQCKKPIIWIHAVSVGETRALYSLISQLHLIYPNHQILITHTTPTGRASSEQLFGSHVLRVYLPYDYPFAVKLFLSHFQPQLGVLVETEIWFNLIHSCHKAGIPLLLLNARMSEKSAKKYSMFASLTRDALVSLDAVLAQTADDASRFTNLGARNVSVMGNLKFDINPPSVLRLLGMRFREEFGSNRKIFLAASTREGEEILLLDHLADLHMPGFLLVIVPRHPQRFNDVANLLERRNIKYQRRSENRLVQSDVQVVLGDSMGEMFAYYVAADIAFIGGSLLPYGGQNLIEALAVDTPVLIGPYTFNFAAATCMAVKARSAKQVQNVNELFLEVSRLLRDDESLIAMKQHCSEVIGLNRGATSKAIKTISAFLVPQNSISTSC